MMIKQEKKKKSIGRMIAGILVKVLFIVLFSLVPNLIPASWAEFYHRNMYGYVSFLPASFSNLFHNSLTELIVVAGGIMLIILSVVFLVELIRRIISKTAGRFVLTVLKHVLTLVLVLIILFDLMLGIGYRRKTVYQYLGLRHGEYTYDEYLQVLEWSYNGMVKARRNIGQDYRGVGHTARSFEANAKYANSLINTVSVKYELPLSAAFIRSKPVAASHYWSMTGIVGMYDPVFVEANINTDYIDITSFPMTLCHEICHAKGLARENDCNLMASIACIHSKDSEYMYAGYYFIFTSLYPVVKEYAGQEGEIFPDYFSYEDMAPVIRDMKASDAYWDDIHSTELSRFIHDIGRESNNLFLKSNGQEGGVATYHVPDNEYVDFYMTYLKGAKNA